MSKTGLQYFVLFILLFLAQVLICNHVVLFHVAVPLIFIYFIIRLPLGLSLNWQLTLAFCLGFLIDIFSDTPGVNALACTLLTIMRKPVFYAYVQRDDKMKDITPTIGKLGLWTYIKYLLSLTVIYCLLAFGIEYFSLADVKEIAISAGASALFTFCLLLGLDSLMTSKREKRL